jgi:molybdate transport system ATP-binding protein
MFGKSKKTVSPVAGSDDDIQIRFAYTPASARDNGFSLNLETTLPGRDVTAVFGPSGSGKTTLLRCLAGLDKPQAGQLVVHGRVWQSDHVFVPTHKRPLGYVFQEASLFSHLTARGNLRYAIKRSAAPAASQQLAEVVDIMGLEALLDQYPQQLSGGERQRVAIARALLVQPNILLMDEPLASLDDTLKREIMPYLHSLREYLDIPIVYVSHSLEEVASLASHVIVLDKGKLQTAGSPEQVFASPDSAQLVWQGTLVERAESWHLVKIACAGGDLWVRDTGAAIGTQVGVAIAANSVSLAREANHQSSVLNQLPVKVCQLSDDDDPAFVKVWLTCKQAQLAARITRFSADAMQLKTGDALWAAIKSAAIVR